MTIEGYAALFGVPDQVADVVRAGAFAQSLMRATPLPLLVEHEQRLLAGEWTDAHEDGRGLYVRGVIREGFPGARRAMALIARGGDGLSIGFVPRVTHRTPTGRVIVDVDLLEISVVRHPMQPLARFRQSPAGVERSGRRPAASQGLPSAA